MQRWIVICWALLALVGAEECPDGRGCEDGQTCCNHPGSGYECCPLDQAECCEDHMHCCPTGTLCDVASSSCVNASVSIPWVERTSAGQPLLSKSFRMIKANMGEEDDNICPDQSRCPPEFSCLKALTKFGCCPLTQGVPCPDGKHCCPEGHQCSADCRSCIKTDLVTVVECGDGVSECPDGTTCCENAEGGWGCCPLPKAVCCADKLHCCPEGSTCDTEHSKCLHAGTRKETPMWAKLPARIRAEWENQKEDSKTADDDEKIPEVTTVPPAEEEVAGTSVAFERKGDIPCDTEVGCPDNTTCCKTKEGGWSCCPLPEAVCCDDFLHCCPHGKKCNLASMTCDDETCSMPMFSKVPPVPLLLTVVGNVACDSSHSCPDGSTCCKTTTGEWACCPLPKAVCCEDHEHCCPEGTTCDLTTVSCISTSGSTPMKLKVPAFVTEAPPSESQSPEAPPSESQSPEAPPSESQSPEAPPSESQSPESPPTESQSPEAPPSESQSPEAPPSESQSPEAPPTEAQSPESPPTEALTITTTTTEQETVDEQMQPEEDEVVPDVEEEEEEEEMKDRIQCADHTSCPQSSTCCFMKSSHRWGCCPLPEAVCCADGAHCCPAQYKCNEEETSCVRGSVEIPWYTKLPALTRSPEPPSAVPCDAHNQCPQDTSCCQLATGQWGCCPLPSAVCCPDQQHCCPHGYTCNMDTMSCQKVLLRRLEDVPLTQVYPPPRPPQLDPPDVLKCDDHNSCPDGYTCCRVYGNSWGCCPYSNAVCCSDMTYCCPNGYSCTEQGECIRDPKLNWYNWHMLVLNKKRALIV